MKLTRTKQYTTIHGKVLEYYTTKEKLSMDEFIMYKTFFEPKKGTLRKEWRIPNDNDAIEHEIDFLHWGKEVVDYIEHGHDYLNKPRRAVLVREL